MLDSRAALLPQAKSARGRMMLACFLLVGAVMALRWMEHLWPSTGWVLFLGLTLTLGMAHGVLDIVILRYGAPLLPGRWPMGMVWLIYAGCALTVYTLACLSFTGALLALLVWSVWHFGEVLDQSWQQRVTLGGAAVMWPALVRPDQLSAALEQAHQGSGFAMTVWSAAAYVWFVMAVMVIVRTWWQTTVRNRLLVEIIGLALLYAMLSPWLAFGLYFAAFHSLAHMRRVAGAMDRHQLSWKSQTVWLMLTVAMTAGLGIMAWWMVGGSVSMQAIQLSWWVAFLTAVTIPHAALISWARCWLD
jgi:Brp/Blh family beta-carotene 15,15'-monooxygenase